MEHRFYHLIQECKIKQDLVAGKILYTIAAFNSLDGSARFGDHLIQLFTSCNCPHDAESAFTHIMKPTLYTWNAIITAHINNERCEKALALYYRMQEKGFIPNAFIFSNALRACVNLRSLYHGNFVYSKILRFGVERDSVINNSLISMFFQCGSVNAAEKVFESQADRDVVTWTTMIGGYVQSGLSFQALQVLGEMQIVGIEPNRVTFLCTLRACSALGNLDLARLLHHRLLNSGFESGIGIKPMLICVYAKCNSLKEAEGVFRSLQNRDDVSVCSAMMCAYAQHGYDDLAFEFLDDKQRIGGEAPNEFMLVCSLNICGKQKCIRKGKEMNDIIMKRGFDLRNDVGNALINMYVNCGCLNEAKLVFDRMVSKDDISWGSIARGYVQHEDWQLALEIFRKMISEDIKLNTFILSSMSKACGSIKDLCQGELVHFQVIVTSLECDTIVGNAILDMYAKCGSLTDAHNVFERLHEKSEVSWGAMIAGYSQQHGCGNLALNFFERMQRESDFKPNEIVLSCVVKACGEVKALKRGMILHEEIIRGGYDSNLVVSNTLIDMYIKCETISEAQRMFDLLPNRDAVSWGTLIDGYAQRGHGNLAFLCFTRMVREGFGPNKVAFLGALKACTIVGDINKGRLLHNQIIQSGIDADIEMSSTLINMYSKCGSLEDTKEVFRGIHSQDGVIWGILSGAYAHHGEWEKAEECLQAIEREHLEFEAVYGSLISAFGHVGRIEGVHSLLGSEYASVPSSIECYNCVADLLGRIGYLKEAQLLLGVIPMFPDAVGWVSLLTACKTYGNVRLGKDCLERLMPSNPNLPFGSLSIGVNIHNTKDDMLISKYINQPA